MKNNPKVAFFHYPYTPNGARLETMPFALNSVIVLATCGWAVDLFLWEEPTCDYSKLLPENVTIHYSIVSIYPNNLFDRIIDQIKLRPELLRLQLKHYHNYAAVFGLGQIGAYLAAITATASKCPFVYVNDEFPSCWSESIWAKLERQLVKTAAMIVVPDIQRFAPLCLELEISAIPYACLPNIPVVKQLPEKINWHQRLNIPQDCTPFLHAGSVKDWAQVPEILSSLPYWTEKTVLIIHSRSSEGTSQYRQQLSHLEVPGRVIWSAESMSEDTLNSLVSYCAGNFALYRNSGPNVEYMGFASGKMMRSLAYGVPVIASNLSSLKFVRDAQIGVLVDHPVEIPTAIGELLHHRESYSQRCLDFCHNYASFEKAWLDFCQQLKNVSGLDLTKPEAPRFN
jgi:glycosyltransferase involved in cell wall biosynthesis